MNGYALVLGDNYLAYAVGAVVAGVLSALLFAEGGLSSSNPNLTPLQIHATKAVVLAIFLFVIWREADDLMDTLVKASFPIGVYKIVQTFVSALVVWRASKSAVPQQEIPSNG